MNNIVRDTILVSSSMIMGMLVGIVIAPVSGKETRSSICCCANKIMGKNEDNKTN